MKEFSERRLVQDAERLFEKKKVCPLSATTQPTPILSLSSEEAAERLSKISLDLAEVRAQLEQARSLLKASRM